MSKKHTDINLTIPHAESALKAWLGSQVKCTNLQRLHGGMINSVWKLSFDKEPYTAVMKIRPAGDNDFINEACKLNYLLDNTSFPCPKVYHEDSTGKYIPFAFLILETIPGESMVTAKINPMGRISIDRQMAEILLELHSHKRATFGNPHIEDDLTNWLVVFVPRLRDMHHKVNSKLSSKILRNIDKALDAAEDVFSQQGEPTLIHGDIWAGNVMVDRKDDGWHLTGIVDPGTQYAHVEMELAYLEVFSTVGDEFFRIYTAKNPLRQGYPLRRLYYWLNTYMIHVWIFGDQHYRVMTSRVAEAIVKQL
ncbi:phosphotransferase [Candidatus Poribacteria bacterium]|nr:phosphotransferase [Candidatus Poribacteria bacterium]